MFPIIDTSIRFSTVRGSLRNVSLISVSLRFSASLVDMAMFAGFSSIEIADVSPGIVVVSDSFSASVSRVAFLLS